VDGTWVKHVVTGGTSGLFLAVNETKQRRAKDD
jgi:hypothetical protein